MVHPHLGEYLSQFMENNKHTSKVKLKFASFMTDGEQNFTLYLLYKAMEYCADFADEYCRKEKKDACTMDEMKRLSY